MFWLKVIIAVCMGVLVGGCVFYLGAPLWAVLGFGLVVLHIVLWGAKQ